jgi:hypothetical protein
MTTIRVITVATQANNPVSPQSYFKQFKASWKRFGVEPVILGWGKPFPTTGAKIKYLDEYLEANKDFDWLIFCDALDTVTTCAPEKLVEKFQLHFDDRAVVFSAERNCFPSPELAASYPHTKSPYKYLNSGLFMGKRESVLDNLARMNSETKHTTQDQWTWTDAYLRRISMWHPIVLDNKCRLFQSLHESLDDLALDSESRIYNKQTLTNPLIFHGNGSTPMEKILKWLKL